MLEIIFSIYIWKVDRILFCNIIISYSLITNFLLFNYSNNVRLKFIYNLLQKKNLWTSLINDEVFYSVHIFIHSFLFRTSFCIKLIISLKKYIYGMIFLITNKRFRIFFIQKTCYLFIWGTSISFPYVSETEIWPIEPFNFYVYLVFMVVWYMWNFW